MAFRLALEAPSRFRAVAAVSANVPTPENFKCKAAGQGTSSVMIMNGTMDPLNPFDGGEVKLFGLFIGRGKVRSSRESGQYFADLNRMAGTPATNQTQMADGVQVEQVLWRKRLQSGSGTRCHPRRWTWHPSAIPAPSAIVRPVAQGTERTGSDLGLLRATAAK
jgi:poly(3-hydroxybutyrate) depolymerase